MKKIAILQSNYIPWKGYFDLINMVDVFVLYDEMQYTKNDWRNRNKVKSSKGTDWLTIPVSQSNLSQTIQETKITNPKWCQKHFNTLVQYYSKAPYFKEYRSLFQDIYLGLTTEYLSEINYTFIKVINEILGIDTKIIWSNDLNIIEGKTERLVDICEKLDGSTYLSGPSAQNYIDESLFLKAGITVEWMDYNGYPEYSQLYPPFEHGVTILDLIFNTGKEANKYMKSFNNGTI